MRKYLCYISDLFDVYREEGSAPGVAGSVQALELVYRSQQDQQHGDTFIFNSVK